MKIIKKLNNNVALGLDRSNRELIVFGKGLGFLPMPYELEDLSLIDRTYYNVDEKYIGLVNEIPEEIFRIATQITNDALLKLKCELNPSFVFTLADHLNFAIERCNKGIDIKNPLSYDIEHMYPTEMAIGRNGLLYIQKDLNITLPKNEATNIAMHIVNAEGEDSDMNDTIRITNILNAVVCIIEDCLQINLNEDSYSYSRFIIHLRYLIKRRKIDEKIISDYKMIYELMKGKYPDVYRCIMKIENYFKVNLNWECEEEEFLYIMLHINRLCGK